MSTAVPRLKPPPRMYRSEVVDRSVGLAEAIPPARREPRLPRNGVVRWLTEALDTTTFVSPEQVLESGGPSEMQAVDRAGAGPMANYRAAGREASFAGLPIQRPDSGANNHG
jgi:hypothetical protein